MRVSDAAAGQQRGQRRGEPDPVGVSSVEVQRLDAEPVAAEQHPAAVALDDREGEHALEVVDEVVAPAVVGLEQHLGVAVREEAVAVALQLVAQLLVVVDAAVPGDGQPQLGVDHRLRAGLGQVDDLQAAVAEGDAALRPHARAVRARGDHDVGHRRDRRYIGRSAVESHLTGGSTHVAVCTTGSGGSNSTCETWLTDRAPRPGGWRGAGPRPGGRGHGMSAGRLRTRPPARRRFRRPA